MSTKMTICGLGHSTHAFIPLLVNRDYDITVLTSKAKDLPENITVRSNLDQEGGARLTSDPEVVKDTPIVLMSVPSDSYDYYLSQFGEYLTKNHTVVVTPGQGTFKHYLDKYCEGAPRVVYMLPMPVNCRTVTLGEEVDVKAYKTKFIVTSDTEVESSTVDELTKMFGHIELVEGGSVLADLMPINPVIHPARLYNLFKDSYYCSEKPLFYEQMTREDTDLMEAIQSEAIAIGKEYKVEVPTLQKFLGGYVYESDYANDLLAFFTKESAYKGFVAPLIAAKEKDGRFHVDPKSRYLTEDIDFGLKVYKQYASKVSIKTPVIDGLIEFFDGMRNELLGKTEQP